MAHAMDRDVRSSRRLTRREALKLAGLSGLTMALLSACGQQAPAPADSKPAESKPAAQPTTAPAAPAAAVPTTQAAPASKPAEAKPAADAKPAVAAKDGGSFPVH